MTKAWQSRPPLGAAIDFPEVLALASGPDPGTSPIVTRSGGRVIVHYSRRRLWLDRDAWESLRGPDDILVQRIRPSVGTAFTIALTRTELERVFGEVRGTGSWDDLRCYHFPKLPPAVDSFRVDGAPAERPPPAVVVRAAPKPLTTTVSRIAPEPAMPRDASIATWAAGWAGRAGGRAESSDYLASVVAWRDAWRPDRVRVLLVAESHVAEEPGDAAVRVFVPEELAGRLPQSFCRLVYCLGYGEDGVCSRPPIRNAGTWQFWDIFGAIAGGPTPLQPRKGASALAERLRWKIDVLMWLRDHGVWLVDACVAGVYQPGGGRSVNGAYYKRMLHESFDQFVWPSVAAEPIQQLWTIGAGVAKALGGHVGVERARTIVQPQGDRGDPGRHRRELAGLVAEVRRIVPARR